MCAKIIRRLNLAELCKGSPRDSAYRLRYIAQRGDAGSLRYSFSNFTDYTPSGKLCIHRNAMTCFKSVTKHSLAELCKGSTADSDSVCLGSNPSSAANSKRALLASALLLFVAKLRPEPSFLPSARNGFAYRLWRYPASCVGIRPPLTLKPTAYHKLSAR